MNRLPLFIVTSFTLGGCGTKPFGYSEVVAAEEERCAGYWRRSGDPDRASEMDRRAMETRRAGANASWEEIFWADLLTAIVTWNRPPEVLKQPPHPSDSRGCE